MPLSTPGTLRVDPVLNSLGNARKVDYFRKNQIIFSQGDRSESVFYIQKGGVKLVVTSRQGKECCGLRASQKNGTRMKAETMDCGI